jgi:hypothetical protein
MIDKMVKYRALAGDLCDAILVEETDRGATIDVTFPNSSERLMLSRIPMVVADDGRRGICFPAGPA